MKRAVKRYAQRSLPASLALIGIFFFSALTSSSHAQISSSSGNSGGSSHSASLAPPTGAVAPPTGAVAPRTGGISPPTGAFIHHGNALNPGVAGSHHGNGHHHSHQTGDSIAYYPYFYGVPVPYVVGPSEADTDASNEADDDNDPEYQGGPTIFDRRGSGVDSYVPPIYEGPAHGDSKIDSVLATQSGSELAAAPPQPETTLIFKDGSTLEIANYAIVGQTLYDLTAGHARRIALTDLDLAATEKQNDDRGVTFQVPSTTQAN